MSTGARAAVGRVAFRQIRTSTLVVAGVCGAMVVSGRSAYDASGGAKVMASLGSLLHNPAIRALYGTPYRIDVAGGFLVWRFGTFIALAAGLWAVFSAARVTRGAEDDGSWDLLAAEPVSAATLLGTTLGVLGGGAVLMGLATFLGFLAARQPLGPSALFAAGIAGLALTFGAVGVVCAQLLAPRRRAAGTAALVLGATFVLRMAGDASSVAVLRWASPFGWLEELRAFDQDRPAPLLLLYGVPAVLVAVVPALAARRDLGAGLLRSSDRAAPRTALLAGPWHLAVRNRLGSLVGWSIGCATFAFILGTVTASMADFVRASPSYQELMTKFGMAQLASAEGYLSVANLTFAGVFGAYAVTALHHEWSDEQDHHLDLPYAAGVTRTTWLGAATVASAGAVLALTAVVGVASWLGAVVSGAGVSLGSCLAATANTLSLVALVLGVVVAGHGLAPRAALPAGVVVLAGGFLLDIFGPALRWPAWVLDLSPFHHLAAVPAVPVNVGGALAMVAIGAVGIAVGLAGYARRDLA